MRIPQIDHIRADDVAAVPAQALRTVFAQVGRLLLAADQFRKRLQADPGSAPKPEPGSASGAADLPVPGYDGLSLPSLRARLRSLDAGQVQVLADYERSHAGRADVVTMFERRIAKLAAQSREWGSG
ncbi:MAG: hypothetical protein ACRDNZ_11710 [Streptosporangiaceae bacterium]